MRDLICNCPLVNENIGDNEDSPRLPDGYCNDYRDFSEIAQEKKVLT